MMGNEAIILKVGGQKFRGWTGVTVQKSLYNMTGTFGLAATDIFPGDAEKWGISMGDSCSIEIYDQTVIDGYIEDMPIDYDDKNHNIQISGRDKTCDLVDCSFVKPTNEWKEPTVKSIILALCAPFEVEVEIDDSVSAQVATKLPGYKKANEGDVVFNIISNLCKVHAILPVSYGDGKLVLTRAGVSHTHDTLELGRNVKSGSLTQSNKDRFQTYTVKGQGVGRDAKTPTETAGSFGQALDDDVILRHRPIVIFPETPIDGRGDCIRRAEWEARVRAGKSRSINYEVQGWTQSNGDIWPLNALVRVKDSFLGIDSTLLIAEIAFSVDNSSGTITRLTVVDPEAFDSQPFTQGNQIKTDFDPEVT